MDAKVVKLKDYQEVNGEFGLYHEEVDVVLAILFHVLDARGIPKKGTFCLESQRFKGSSYKVVSFNFPGGRVSHFYGSDSDSERVSSYVLEHASTYVWGNGMGAVRTGFNFPDWMNLEADNGRFLATFYADRGYDKNMKEIYLTVIKTISMLADDDQTLQKNCAMTIYGQFEDVKWATALETYIDDLFDNDKLPEIVAWKEWKKSANCPRKDSFFE
jgi:hypothetical protein